MFATFIIGYNHAPPVLNFSNFNGSHFRSAGSWMDNIDRLHTLCTMHRRCVAAFSTGLLNIPTPVDQDLDGREVQTHIKIDALG